MVVNWLEWVLHYSESHKQITHIWKIHREHILTRYTGEVFSWIQDGLYLWELTHDPSSWTLYCPAQYSCDSGLRKLNTEVKALSLTLYFRKCSMIIFPSVLLSSHHRNTMEWSSHKHVKNKFPPPGSHSPGKE